MTRVPHGRRRTTRTSSSMSNFEFGRHFRNNFRRRPLVFKNRSFIAKVRQCHSEMSSNLNGYGSLRFACSVLLVLLGRVALIDGQTPQPNVVSDGRRYGVFVWIYLKPGADLRAVGRAASRVLAAANDTCLTPGCSPGDEVITGIGFGSNLYNQITTSDSRMYAMKNRKGDLGSLPSTGGDVLIHGKSNNFGKLFELAQIVQKLFPADSAASFIDTYGFTYKEGRDLSGFIDGTENPSLADRQSVALDQVGGSYCITQQWIHKLDFISQQANQTLEGFVGRRINDSSELTNKSLTSHVARMTSGNHFKAPKPVQMYRQSMPYGRLSDRAGLFFIGFAASINNFDYFLNRMVGESDNKSDDIMRLSNCVSGNYWYFPSVEELGKLQNTNQLNGKLFKSDQNIDTPHATSTQSISDNRLPVADQQTKPRGNTGNKFYCFSDKVFFISFTIYALVLYFTV